MPLGIKVQPWADAVGKISAKTPLGAYLRSEDWDRVPLAIREAAFFSARVESARLLSDMQKSILDALQGNRTPGGALMERGRFISDMRKLAQQLGVGRLGVADITDMQGPARLGLIYDMQTRQARGFARWKANHDPDMMNEWPAQRLIRIADRKEPRDWNERWQQAAMAAGFVGVARSGMIALKDSPIWTELSRFGTPWPPFDYGSGMGVEDVSRGEAERLGLVIPGEVIEPTGEQDFAELMEASIKNMPEEFRDLLTKSGYRVMGDEVSVSGKAAAEKATKATQEKLVKQTIRKTNLHKEGLVHVASGKEEDFKDHIDAIRKIPRKVADRLKRNGFNGVELGETSVSGFPGNEHLKGVIPRGWKGVKNDAGKQATWDDVPGCYQSREKRVILGRGKHGSANMPMHEIGHALGDVFDLDNSPELIKHHKRLFGDLSDYEKQGGPGGKAGRQEMLAEAVAHLVLLPHGKTLP